MFCVSRRGALRKQKMIFQDNQGLAVIVLSLQNSHPTLAISEDAVPITPLLAAAAINRNVNYNPYGPLYSSTTTGNPYTSPYYPSSTTGYPYTYQSTSSGGCSFSYPGVCIQHLPPDLNCRDVLPSRDFRVLPSYPHGFDRDGDGIGCDLEDGV
jgi:hypothetical protein